jgi:hypothetical protein
VVQIAMARPFSYHPDTLPALRYGVGLYDAPDEVAQHPFVLPHLQAAILAGGGILLQPRLVPTDVPSFRQLDIHALEIVPMILPGRAPLYAWPPAGAPPFRAGELEPAPGLITYGTPTELAPGQWVLPLVTAPAQASVSPADAVLLTLPCPGTDDHTLLAFPPMPEHGDVCGHVTGKWFVYAPVQTGPGGFARPGAGARGVMTVRPPDHPPDDPMLAAQVQAQRARMGRWVPV